MIATIHEVAPEEIMAHHDGELPADRAQQVSSHLETCAECRDLARSLSGTSQSLAAWNINSTANFLHPNYKPLLLLDRAGPNRLISFWHLLRARRTALALGAVCSLVLLALLSIGTGNYSTRRKNRASEMTDGAALAQQDSPPSLEKGVVAGGGGGGGQGGGYAPVQVQSDMMAVAQTPM